MDDIKKLSRQFLVLAEKARRLRAQSVYFAELLRSQGPGRYPHATVYVVRAHAVRAHTRREHVVVRAYPNRRKKVVAS